MWINYCKLDALYKLGVNIFMYLGNDDLLDGCPHHPRITILENLAMQYNYTSEAHLFKA